MQSTEQATWQGQGVPASLWVPFVAHAGLSLLWWSLYMRPAIPEGMQFLPVMLAGSLTWPAIGGARLTRARGPWAVSGLAYVGLQVLIFTWLPAAMLN